MKIVTGSGERVLIIVPSRLASSAAIAVEDDEGIALIDVCIEDGLLGSVQERAVHRHPVIVEDRLVLWGHLVSKHAAIIPLHATLEELIATHNHEHTGPGTIRNHEPASREHSLKRIGEVLSEAEPEDDEPESYEGSFCEAADNEGARIAAESREEDD